MSQGREDRDFAIEVTFKTQIGQSPLWDDLAGVTEIRFFVDRDANDGEATFADRFLEEIGTDLVRTNKDCAG
jgi:hypothetical protein